MAVGKTRLYVLAELPNAETSSGTDLLPVYTRTAHCNNRSI